MGDTALPEYRRTLQGRARLLRAEGLSLSQIAEQIGVPKRTVAHWLEIHQSTSASVANARPMGHHGTRGLTAPRYLLRQESIERFTPPEGIRFPLIIADPPCCPSQSLPHDPAAHARHEDGRHDQPASDGQRRRGVRRWPLYP